MVIHGGNVLITTAAGSPIIAASKSCTISVKADDIEVISPLSNEWKEFITQRKEWSVSLSHLVTMGQFPQCLLVNGTQLTLKIGLRSPSGTAAPFNGEYAGQVSDHTTTGADGVYWHGILKQFVGYVNDEDKYYKYWAQSEVYTSPSTSTPYTYNDKTYVWTPDEGLIQLKRLTGNAIITDAKVTATKGNLSQGSWSLKGNGSLTMEDA